MFDLDRFKDVNDSLGHRNGDALLTRLSERLSTLISPSDVLARLGGDEFGVILRGVDSQQVAHERLSRLRAGIAEPVQIDGLPLIMDASVGFAFIGQDRRDAETLLQRADIAMHVAKNGRTAVVQYDRLQDHYDAEQLAVVGEPRRAISNDELLLHYQPKLRLRDGTITAVEALIRWQHPRRGLLYPDSFLPVAKQTDLIHPVTEWVVATQSVS